MNKQDQPISRLCRARLKYAPVVLGMLWGTIVWAAQVCTNSSITTEDLFGISGNSDSNVIAVGESGQIWKYNGTSWSAMTSPTTKILNDIEVLSGGTAYAVGQAADHTVGSLLCTGVPCKEGNVLKFDGTSWTSILITDLNQNLSGVWADATSEVYAVGQAGSLQVYDGTSWTDLSTVAGTGADLTDAWGDTSNFYALAEDGLIYVRDRSLPATAPNAANWTTITACESVIGVFNDIWGTGASDLYFAIEINAKGAVYHYNGTTCTESASTTSVTELLGIHGSPGASGEIYAVGNSGVVMFFDGSAWYETSEGSQDLNDVWLSTNQNAYYTGLSGQASQCTFVAGSGSGEAGLKQGAACDLFTVSTGVELTSVSGSSDSNVIAVGTLGEIWQYNGTSWSAMTSPTTEDLADIHVLSGTIAYAAGRDTDGSVGGGKDEGNVLKFDGTSWTSILITDLDERLNGVWAGSASEVYAVGRGGALQVYDGSSWTDLSTVAGATADRLNDAWGDAAFFYALAQDGTIYKRDRALPATAPDADNWTTITACEAVTGAFNGIWGTGPSDLYFAVAATIPDRAAVYHYNGTTCTESTSTTTVTEMTGIYGSSGASGEIYAVGGTGVFLFFDGSTWYEISPEGTCTAGGGCVVKLNDVWLSANDKAYYASFGGVLKVCDSAAIAHYAISFPLGTPGITCEAQAIRVTAHNFTDATLLAPSTTTITASTVAAADSWMLRSGGGTFNDLGGGGSATYQFSGSESFVDLWLTETTPTTTPHIDIDVTDTRATDRDGFAEDDNAQFDEAIFRFFAGDGTTQTPESIGTQISAKPSSTAPGDQTIQLRSVRTNTTTLECEAAFTGTEAIELAFQCNDPATCATVNGVTVTAFETKAIADNPNTGVSTYTSVNMNFSTAGIAAFSFRYDDAGKISLHARKVLVADATDSPPTTADTLTGSSNTFLVRPFGFGFTNINAGGFANPLVNTPGGTVFTTAGSNFAATVGAYLWASGEDADSDGNPDTGANITDNGAALNYDFDTTITAVAPFEPATGSLGSVNNGAILTGAFTNGVTTVSTLQYPEVGSMTLQADATDYLGDTSGDIVGDTTNDGTSGVVGRFTPFAFNVSLDTTPAFTPGCSSNTTPFTYLDQGFNYSTAPMVTMVAVNELGATTANYDGSWWRLADFTETNAHVVGDALTGGVTLDGTLAGHTAIDCSGDTCNGVFQTTFAGPFTYAKSTTAIGPFNGLVDISFAITDADGVSYATNPFVVSNIAFTGSNNQQRWGRLVVAEETGSEQMVLNVPLTTEYYDGTSYLLNTDDDCTAFTLSSQADLTSIASGTLGGDQAMVIKSGTTSITTGNPVLTDGAHTFTFSAPGVDNVGFVDIEIDLTAAIMDWLLFDWDGDGSFDDHPVGRASFGIIARPKQLIYTREPW